MTDRAKSMLEQQIDETMKMKLTDYERAFCEGLVGGYMASNEDDEVALRVAYELARVRMRVREREEVKP